MPIILFSAILLLSICPQGVLGIGIPDWIGHGVAYCTMMVVAARRLDGHLIDIAIAIFAVGLAIELLQGLTPHRSSSLDDILANAVGIGFGCLIVLRRPVVVMIGALSVAGCSAYDTPRNYGPVTRDGGFQQTQRALPEIEDTTYGNESFLQECKPNFQYDSVPLLPRLSGENIISHGDLLRVTIGEDELLSGDYEIETDGALRLPKVSPVRAHGISAQDLTKSIESKLIAEQLYRAAPSVSVRILERSAVRVHLAGAVFEPGTTEIGGRSAETRDLARQSAYGDPTYGRGVIAALQGVAGLRPDADTQRILLKRDGKMWRLDLRPAAINKAFYDPILLSGDQLRIPSLECFQPGLARPTAVTRKGIKIHLSNLTIPANSNSASAIDPDVREVTYGTRMLQALVRMNCVGGTQLTNADRWAVLISRNPATGRSDVIERKIEDLVRRADRDNHDPVLMPGDAIACYDSNVTNARDIARSLLEVIAPSPLLLGVL
jgi:protein involved in polysaccharide export with SLBB domain